jgi:hypothetical protein
MPPENAVTTLTFKSGLLEVSAVGHFAIGALVLLVVISLVCRAVKQWRS